MSFLCPKCTINTLNIIKMIELPPDSRSDETSVQVVQCQKCGLQGVAIYEESRRGSLASESYSHTGYLLPEKAIEMVIQAIEKCPDNKNSKCKCSSHTFFNILDEGKRWVWINTQPILDVFQMKIG